MFLVHPLLGGGVKKSLHGCFPHCNAYLLRDSFHLTVIVYTCVDENVVFPILE